MAIIFALCKVFGLDSQLTASLLSKSVTTPIAMGVTEQLGGIVPIGIAAVIFTGITGSIVAPFMVKLFHISDPIAQGVGIGACSHAVGTTRAIAMGELQGGYERYRHGAGRTVHRILGISVCSFSVTGCH